MSGQLDLFYLYLFI